MHHFSYNITADKYKTKYNGYITFMNNNNITNSNISNSGIAKC